MVRIFSATANSHIEVSPEMIHDRKSVGDRFAFQKCLQSRRCEALQLALAEVSYDVNPNSILGCTLGGLLPPPSLEGKVDLIDELGHQHRAKSIVFGSRSLELINRYKSRYDLQYLRAHRRFLELVDRRTPPPDKPRDTVSARQTRQPVTPMPPIVWRRWRVP